MPAIDLARLKIQAASLGDQFANPNAFLRALHEVLDFYTNRTMRPARGVRRLSVPTHHTPNPVLRQVERELAPLASIHPQEALALTEALWKAGSLETRLLAARLLGAIPLEAAVPALSRLPDWLIQTTDREIRTALLTDTFMRLRSEQPEAFFTLLEAWLKSPRSGFQVWGLRALIPLLEQPGFENLPAVFRILRPAVEKAGISTQAELQACLVALENVSATETLVFLRGILEQSPDPMLVRTLRRILPALRPELQSGLRDLVRGQDTTPIRP